MARDFKVLTIFAKKDYLMIETPNWPTIQYKQSSLNVMALQHLLRYHGYNIDADGIFGNGTKTAVVDFQSSNNLTADGAAGKDTLPALIATVSSRNTTYLARAAQTLLDKFEVLTVDGDFYTGSVTATKNFQKKMGIAETGSVNATTWLYLFGYNAYPNLTSTGVYASNAMVNSGLTPNQFMANARYIYNYLRGKGFTKNAACAVIGNMEHESDIDPGVWERYKNTSKGYGLVQWTPATKFLNRAYNLGYIANATAESANSLAKTTPKVLMDAELEFLISSCQNTSEFYAPTGDPYNLTFSTFKSSTMSAGTLAVIFHDYYERSADSEEIIQERSNKASAWYNYF